MIIKQIRKLSCKVGLHDLKVLAFSPDLSQDHKIGFCAFECSHCGKIIANHYSGIHAGYVSASKNRISFVVHMRWVDRDVEPDYSLPNHRIYDGEYVDTQVDAHRLVIWAVANR